MASELKVGILAIVGLAVFIFGYYFLKGKTLINNDKVVYVLVEDAAGVVTSNAVSYHGRQIGRVKEVLPVEQGSYRVLFELAIHKNIEIPQSSLVKIIELDLLGNKELRIVEPDSFSEYVSSRDTLYGTIKGSILSNITNEIAPVVERTKPFLSNIDSLASNIQQALVQDKEVKDASLVALSLILDNLEEMATDLDASLEQQTELIDGLINNTDALSVLVQANTIKIDSILANITKSQD